MNTRINIMAAIMAAVLREPSDVSVFKASQSVSEMQLDNRGGRNVPGIIGLCSELVQ
jgi:hypothetical protein